ncbi:MAG: hypothetical protein OYL97_20450 [Candidatus Poribacteria bacterium]|nr:hypothetical protein [Candidatus Poribacteria bacterium]
MMSDQDFRERVLNAIEDLKRTNERSVEEVKESIADLKQTTERSIEEVKRTNERSIEEVKESIAEVKRTNERSFEEIKHNTKNIDTGLRSVETDVAWIKGTFEGKQEAISNKDVKSAIWIALGSALAAIISLIKSFW